MMEYVLYLPYNMFKNSLNNLETYYGSWAQARIITKQCEKTLEEMVEPSKYRISYLSSKIRTRSSRS